MIGKIYSGGVTGSVPVCVVDDGVERLVCPLPEDDLRRRLVERHHEPRDRHVARNLREKHFINTQNN